MVELKIADGQINDRPDGSVEILGLEGYIVVKGKYAETIKASYKAFLESYPKTERLEMVISIDVPQPIGKWDD